MKQEQTNFGLQTLLLVMSKASLFSNTQERRRDLSALYYYSTVMYGRPYVTQRRAWDVRRARERAQEAIAAGSSG
jgi:hypothetical protein